MLAAQLTNSLLEQMGVELEPDRRDVSGLLLSQEVTRAPNLEIVRRQAESAAQIVQLLEHPQALLGVGSDEVLAGDHQIGVGTVMGTADARADLVELGEPEGIGSVDDDRVGARVVEAGLDGG